MLPLNLIGTRRVVMDALRGLVSGTVTEVACAAILLECGVALPRWRCAGMPALDPRLPGPGQVRTGAEGTGTNGVVHGGPLGLEIGVSTYGSV